MTLLTEPKLPEIAIFSPEFEADPHTIFADLRARGVNLARSERGIEVLRYDTVTSVLRDRRFYWPGVKLMESNGILSGNVYDRWAQSIINLNGEAHSRLRRLAMLGFNRAVVEGKRESMSRIVDQLVDELGDRTTIDFATEFAQRLPSMLFCEIIGSPVSDAPLIAEWSLALNKILHMDPKGAADVERAWASIEEYVEDQIPQRSGDGSDLLQSLLKAEQVDGGLTRVELVTLMSSILSGSTDSTANQLCMTVHALSRKPELWQQLREDPSLVPVAVEEGIRVSPRQIASLRISDEDVEIDGVTVPANTMVGVCVASANRDFDAYENPDEFLLVTPRGKPQLSFGAGVHSCIGSGIARVEMEEALGVLTRRFAEIHELPGADIAAKGGHAVEVEKLPLGLTAA